MAGTPNPDILAKHWVHSHEEDTGDQLVFRPSSFTFAPSRGRRSYDLKPDGTLGGNAIGSTDRKEVRQGRWELQGEDCLVITQGPDESQRTDLKILSVQPDRLVVHR